MNMERVGARPCSGKIWHLWAYESMTGTYKQLSGATYSGEWYKDRGLKLVRLVWLDILSSYWSTSVVLYSWFLFALSILIGWWLVSPGQGALFQPSEKPCKVHLYGSCLNPHLCLWHNSLPHNSVCSLASKHHLKQSGLQQQIFLQICTPRYVEEKTCYVLV